MRGNFQWSAAPEGVFVPAETISRRKEKKNATPVIVNREADAARVRRMVKEVSPEALRLFARLFVNRDLREFVRAFESPADIPAVAGTYSYQVIEQGGVRTAVLFRMRGELSDELARGGTASLFIFAARFHQGACRAIMKAASCSGSGLDGWYVRDEYDPDDLWESLCIYRMARSAAEGLNKVTKMNQLAKIDQDHVMLKFSGCDMGIGNDCEPTLHVGSGKLGGTLFTSHEGTVCVDPLNTVGVGVDTYFNRLEDVEIGEFDIIYSDAAVGDATGLKTSPVIQDLNGRLAAEATRGARVYLKLNANDNIGPRGRLVRKPRPHNSEIIWEVDPEGPTYLSQIGNIRRDIMKANDKRMENLFLQTPSYELKDVQPGPYKLDAFLSRALGLPKPPTHPKHTPPDAFFHKITNIPTDKASQRQALWAKKLWAFSVEDYQRLIDCFNAGTAVYSVIPRSHLRKGHILFMDPLVGHVPFSINSLFISMRLLGWNCWKTPTGWLSS